MSGWRVALGPAISLALSLVLCQGATAEVATEPAAPIYLSLVIDDLGQSPMKDDAALALPGPVTLAIMPDTPHASEFARQAHAAHKSIILHMPMDPADGPFAWHPDMPQEELAKRLDAALKMVPFASGINNHMGSRMTAQPQAMGWLMADLQQRGLFFLDSRTSAKTVAAAEAQKIGLASVSRDVFLDDTRTPEAITAQFESALKLARQQGSVVMIGHPYPQTIEVLNRELPRLQAEGIRWISLKHMIAVRGNQAMAAHGKGGVYK